MSQKEHWNDIYDRKEYSEVTWFQPEPKQSLSLIRGLQLEKTSKILDVGAGSSTLVDFLLKDGFQFIYLLDISQNAFSQSKKRLGEMSKKVNWLEGDVRNFQHSQKFDLWHDRAVFHFLTNTEDQNKYLKRLNDSLEIGAFFIISTFAEDGPLKCSGLEIVRYAKDELIHNMGVNFELMDFKKETHTSPGRMKQKFNYWVFKKLKQANKL